MLFSLLKHYLDLYITDTALKVSRSLYYFNTSISHNVENYFPRLWGTCISDAIFFLSCVQLKRVVWYLVGLMVKIEVVINCRFQMHFG